MKIKNEDKALLKGLIKLLQEGTFPLQAKEVSAFAKVYQWVLNLEERFEELEEVIVTEVKEEINYIDEKSKTKKRKK